VSRAENPTSKEHCAHCWHVTQQYSDAFATYRDQTCCHCNAHERQRIEHVRFDRLPEKKHGPFEPKMYPTNADGAR
jgi:hypothetical protein